jgi:hypothetical protein
MGGKHKTEIYTGGALATALVFLNATRAFSGPSIDEVVKACVQVARAHGAEPAFDCYYNTATGSAECIYLSANTHFAFQKCLAERGFPISKTIRR